MKVLSYGGGVQTAVLLRMAIEGRLERPDIVVFADTQGEPQGVYDTVDREFAYARQHGIECIVVTKGELANWRR